MIGDFKPSRGIIEAAIGDTIRIELQAAQLSPDYSIAPDSLWDSSALLRSPVFAYVNPDATSTGLSVRYSFPVTSAKVLWLHVMFNNDAVLRYRLRIRQPGEGEVAKDF